MRDNVFHGNQQGANFYHVALTASGNTFTGNFREGLRVRESVAEVFGRVLFDDRFVEMVNDKEGLIP